MSDLKGDKSFRRILSSIVDNLCAMFIAVLFPVFLFKDFEIWGFILAIFIYLLYYFLCEGAFSTTIGKKLFSLEIVNLNGNKITWLQALIRTLFRLIEVNPVFGSLPAIISIILSKKAQRIGDIIAKTVVQLKY